MRSPDQFNRPKRTSTVALPSADSYAANKLSITGGIGRGSAAKEPRKHTGLIVGKKGTAIRSRTSLRPKQEPQEVQEDGRGTMNYLAHRWESGASKKEVARLCNKSKSDCRGSFKRGK